jgi:hypothetical protein
MMSAPVEVITHDDCSRVPDGWRIILYEDGTARTMRSPMRLLLTYSEAVLHMGLCDSIETAIERLDIMRDDE